MSFDPRLFAYVESPICILAFDSIFVCIFSIVRNPWSSLIPLSRGSFDVIVGTDWLSKRKFMIVCHEKVVRIPLKGEEILRVHGERTQGVVRTLMNTKVVHGATPVAKPPYRLEPSEMQESSEQLQELEDKERLRGLDQQMERKGDECLYFMDQIWVLLVGSVMDEAHASRRRQQCQRLLACCNDLRYLSENEIESPWILSLNFQGQSSEYDVILDNSKEWNSGDDRLRLRWMYRSGSYQLSTRCAPFTALYGRKCRSHVLWAEIGGSSLIGPDGRKMTEYEVGENVLLKVSPWKGVMRFGKKGKLAPRYVRPFEIHERIGPMAYRLRLPEELIGVHDTFHVSNLKKCLGNANFHVPLNEIKIDKTLCFVEEPVEIMDREVKRLKRSRISILSYLLIVLLNQLVKSRDEISIRRGYCDNRYLSRIVYTFRNG
ncbi:hypothetical protein Tco_0343063 [Tanacetum coccineum]